MEWKPALQGIYGSNMNAFGRVAVEIRTFEKLEHKILTQCDADTDDRGDYNYYSSPCTSYRRAKINVVQKSSFFLFVKKL